MANAAVQRELAEIEIVGYLLVEIDLTRGHQYSNGYRKVIRGAFFAKISGSEVYCNAFVGEETAAVLDCRSYAIFGFVYGSTSQPCHHEVRTAIGDFDLHLDERAL